MKIKVRINEETSPLIAGGGRTEERLLHLLRWDV